MLILSFCAIVKDEAANIARCLDSIKPYVDEMALLHKHLKPLYSRDRQQRLLIDESIFSKAFRRKPELLCNNAD